eukprot:449135-Pelagomonas_calceolata.AAC.2
MRNMCLISPLPAPTPPFLEASPKCSAQALQPHSACAGIMACCPTTACKMGPGHPATPAATSLAVRSRAPGGLQGRGRSCAHPHAC